jgi:hypothetical protein
MAIDPSFRLELDTATTLRDWLLDASHGTTTETVVAESLAELAAGIDGQLHGQSEYLEISVSTTEFPPANSSPSLDAQSEMSECDDLADQDTDAVACPAERNSVETDPSQVYDALPDDAWQPPTEEGATPLERSSTPTNDHEQTPTATPDSAASPPNADLHRRPPALLVALYPHSIVRYGFVPSLLSGGKLRKRILTK